MLTSPVGWHPPNTICLIQLLIVDDHPVRRDELSRLLNDRQQFHIAGITGECAKAIATVIQQAPDVILLFLHIHNDEHAIALSCLHAAAPHSRIIVYAEVVDAQLYQRIVRAGAHGVVLLQHMARDLSRAIKCVHGGEVWLPRVTIADIINGAQQDEHEDAEMVKITSLTQRERQMIALVVLGQTNSKIAEQLFISEPTVRNYLVTIYRKLQVTNRLELATYARQHGLLYMSENLSPDALQASQKQMHHLRSIA